GSDNGDAQGLGANDLESKTVLERQLWLSQILQVVFNMAIYIFSSCLIILSGYQLIFMCYLFLLGPLAAAFYAWPAMENQSSPVGLFRGVFSNWLDAVIKLSMWRFYWMVILAIMCQRILFIKDHGETLSNLQWEVAVFICLLGLM